MPVEWIRDVIMGVGKMSKLNAEARAIVLVLIETGARPSEICNLTSSMIILEHKIPHLKIEPSEDPEDPREIKTRSSVRTVPLLGVALEAMRRYPNGFPRYKDKESSLSAALNKFFRENELMPSDRHTIYSIRHAFEDRMKEARVDSEVRRILMGHTVDRPEYGEGGSLLLRQQELAKITLKYDASIV
jgi:integrase